MNKIIQGDALTTLKTLPSDIVQTCITSPPYYSLRDYNVDGQIGLESSPEEYIDKLVQVFREVKRVLRDDGTLWINIADSYAGSGKGGQSEEKRSENWQPTYANKGLTPRGYKPKDLYGIPWMLAFALRAEGYYLRQDIIWHKPNCMPESVEDRPTKSHEYIFLLSKSERYFYDADAIREPAQDWGPRDRSNFRNGTMDPLLKHHGLLDGNFEERGRNKRSVWRVSTQSYSAAHFATFPPKLIEPCILAGTSARACEVCGAPWERGWQPTGHINKREPAHAPHSASTKTDSTGWRPMTMPTDQWEPTCYCNGNTGSGSCIVLDPFAGAGTVPLVSLKYHRAYIGIELNQSYIDLANKRIHTTQPVLWEIPA